MAKTEITNHLAVSVRSETGKGASRRARRNGKVPAVLYGHGTDPQHLELSAHEYAAVLRNSGANAVLVLEIEGKEQLALTKALDIHPIRRTIQHADLLVVKRGEKVIVEVNVILEGESFPGTLVTSDATWVEIEAEALSIPDQLTISIEGAEAGTQVLAGELELPSGVTLISDPELLLVNVVEPKVVEEPSDEEAAEAAAEGGEAAAPEAE